MSLSQELLNESFTVSSDENSIKNLQQKLSTDIHSTSDEKSHQVDSIADTSQKEEVEQEAVSNDNPNISTELISSEPPPDTKSSSMSGIIGSGAKFSFHSYPTLNAVYKILSKRYTKYQYPADNTPVFNGWESAVYHAIQSGCCNIGQIKKYIFGSWVLDSSGQLIQLNLSNLSILLNPKVLLETAYFKINNYKEDSNQSIDELKIKSASNSCFGSKYRFIFNSENDFPFKLLVICKSRNILKKHNPFTFDELFATLNLKTYRSSVNTYEVITKEDTFRIQYILEQSNYFTKDENGKYSERGVTLEFDQTSTQNDLVDLMIRYFPIGHCFYKSEIEIISKLKNISFLEEKLIQNNRIFYIGGRYGVRQDFEFRKQIKARNINMKSRIPDILLEVVIKILSRLTHPISMASLFHAIKNQSYFDILKGRQVINEDVYNKIRFFMKTAPIVICQNKKYFMIPKISECDIYGHLYISSIRNFCVKNINRMTESDISDGNRLLNDFRFPISKNEAVFVVYIKSQPQALFDLFEISCSQNKRSQEKIREDNNENDINRVIFETINNSVCDDGEISENEFLHNDEESMNPKFSFKNSDYKTTSNENDIMKKIDDIANSKKKNLINFLNFDLSSTKKNELVIKSKKQKKLLDNIPGMENSAFDHQQPNENKAQVELDFGEFENDATISDLEKKMIRVALKNFDPKVYSFSRPIDYAAALKGQKAVNIEGREFIIDKSPESLQIIENELMISKRFGANTKKNKYHFIGEKKSSALIDFTPPPTSLSFEALDALPAETYHKKTSLNKKNSKESNKIISSDDDLYDNSEDNNNEIESDDDFNQNGNDLNDEFNNFLKSNSENSSNTNTANTNATITVVNDDDDGDDDEIEIVQNKDLVTHIWSKPQLRMDADPADEKQFDIIEDKSRTLAVCPTFWKPPTMSFVKPQPKFGRIRKLVSTTNDLQNDPRIFSLFESYGYENTEDLYEDLLFTVGRLSTIKSDANCKK